VRIAFSSYSAASAPGRARLDVNVNRLPNAMSVLIGRNFRVDPGVKAEIRMGGQLGRAWASCTDTRFRGILGSGYHDLGLGPTSGTHSLSGGSTSGLAAQCVFQS
jgi:hypothetical protein